MNKKWKMLLNKKGFSLVELIMVIAIMVILIALLVPGVAHYINKANKSVSLSNAQTMCNMAQVAIMTAQSDHPAAFEYSTKYNVVLNTADPVQAKIAKKYGNTIKVARFTNKTLYQYVNNKTSSNKSADADMKIAKIITEGLSTHDYLVDCNPIDNRKSTKYISDHGEQYGDFAFAFCYNEKGEMVYFESTYKGYFVQIIAGETTIEEVSDDTYFCDWPKKSQRIDPSW